MINMKPSQPSCTDRYEMASTAVGTTRIPGPAANAASGMSTSVYGNSYGNGGSGTVNVARANDRGYADEIGRSGMESELAPYHGSQKPMAYGDEDYGPDFEWSEQAEEGLSSIPQDDFDQPLSAGEAARSSWRALLARNIGRNVLVSFLVGTQNTVVAEGELFEVGTDYLVIYQPLWNSHISADLYSVKFVEFREPPGQTLN